MFAIKTGFLGIGLICHKPTLSTCARAIHHKFNLGQPNYDTDYLLNRANVDAIQYNIEHRKGVGNIQLVHELSDRLGALIASDVNKRKVLNDQLQAELRKIPNRTHPEVLGYGDKPRLVRNYGEKPTFDGSKIFEFAEMAKKMNIFRMEKLANFTGHKSYYLTGELAELEQALIRYTITKLLANNFKLITVPDILPARIIESCGMSTHGERNQVYKLNCSPQQETLCLSGTSEMALAGYFAGAQINEADLPLKLTAVSRCFRAETSALQEEKGIYRVHQFTKVEMFSVCRPDQSEGVLEEFRDIEVGLFDAFGFHFQLLDMPACELGASAYRKYDIEAWLPGREMYGEISSCSDCTDYQARRLGIRYRSKVDDQLHYAHTVNGTACAIPRMLIALLENFQNKDLTVTIPQPLRRFMRGKDTIRRKKQLPELKLTKRLAQEEIC
ncbi:serine--tRNA ligase, mitochondrial [Toxorhynchites rutilus septentrionalis]|uniref:serine--tRNA ligase, mitochondrial n=1 Tax=Toxorhynchites rutilus septentrionalis TaxID=329112 RepID=UPI0024797274|nr:serine--tRNA ligase, mitochondrial [Toxorhynchites rutilus septentrionalis]